MKDPLDPTPRERAWSHFAAEAVRMGMEPTSERVRYADEMVKTTSGQMCALSYALDDMRDALIDPALKAGRSLSAFIRATRR